MNTLRDIRLADTRYLIMLAVPGLLLLWVLLTKRRPNARLSNRRAARPTWQLANGPWRYITGGVLLLVMVLATLVAARPVYATTTKEPRSAVMLVLDVSTSMTASDVAPSRLEAAQAAMAKMVSDAPPDLNIGLVTVGGNASLVLSPSVERQPLLTAIHALKPVPGGTATGEGLITASEALDSVASFGSREPLPARILLISDGKEEIREGLRDSAEATKVAVRAGYPVYTVNYGTQSGTINGQPIRSDPETLAEIAVQTGGESFQAATQGDLETVMRSIPGAVAEVPTETTFPLWTRAAAIVLMITAALGFIGFRYS